VGSDHFLRWLLDQPANDGSGVRPAVGRSTGGGSGAIGSLIGSGSGRSGVARDAGSAWLRAYVVRRLVLALVFLVLLLAFVVPAVVEALDGLSTELNE